MTTEKLKVLSAGAVKSGVGQLVDAYARERGNDVDLEFTTAPEVQRRAFEDGDMDLIVAPPGVIDELVRAGKVAQESRVHLGRSRVGVVVHSTSQVREVPDADCFRQIVAAPAVVVRNKASSGAYAAKLYKDFGVEDARVVVVDSGAAVMQFVADHPEAVGLAQISEIRNEIAKGVPVGFPGPLPDALQNVTSYEACSVVGRAREAEAKGLAKFMGTDDAKKIFATTGID